MKIYLKNFLKVAMAGAFILSMSLVGFSQSDQIDTIDDGRKKCFLSSKCNPNSGGSCTGHWC